jgi:Tfp pilus assembly major pilin PilA
LKLQQLKTEIEQGKLKNQAFDKQVLNKQTQIKGLIVERDGLNSSISDQIKNAEIDNGKNIAKMRANLKSRLEEAG